MPSLHCSCHLNTHSPPKSCYISGKITIQVLRSETVKWSSNIFINFEQSWNSGFLLFSLSALAKLVIYWLQLHIKRIKMQLVPISPLTHDQKVKVHFLECHTMLPQPKITQQYKAITHSRYSKASTHCTPQIRHPCGFYSWPLGQDSIHQASTQLLDVILRTTSRFLTCQNTALLASCIKNDRVLGKHKYLRKSA